MQDAEVPLASRHGTRDTGEDTEFAEFYRSRYTETVRLAYRLVGSRQAAEDVAQDVFVGLHTSFHEVSNRDAYLRVGVVNRCKNVWRQEARERRHWASVRPMDLPPTGASELFDALMKLPYRQRAVLVLRYWADWPESEIANVLRCRPTTVRQLAYRALIRLRREIRP